jgi:hypothetical protein
VLDTSPVIKKINYPVPEIARERVARLDDQHLLRPPLIRTNDVLALSHTNADGRSADGWCDGITLEANDECRASGWAALPGQHRPADSVVLAYENGTGNWRAFAVSDAVVERADIVQHLGTREQAWSGWTAHFPRAAVPAGAKVSAWAFDAAKSKLYRLRQNSLELVVP